MNRTKLLAALVATAVASCNLPKKDKAQDGETLASNPNTTISIAGTYVSSDYQKRHEGYDWIGIIIHENADKSITIKIRSRADLKKPTCTLDATAVSITEGQYKAVLEGKTVLFSFNNKNLTIDGETDSDSSILSFYCSGGGSLKGNYQKIDSNLDSSQVDSRTFQKVLSLQNISFSVESQPISDKQQLTITPLGLSIDNRHFTHDITGQSVVNAEIEDLNKDGFPEILVYLQSHGSGSYGNVIAYSVNNGKSMSQINFPQVADNKKLKDGYQGHDEFTLVEHKLVQRFPIYLKNDVNANPTGKTRQIAYELKDGEPSPKFIVKDITEF
ncbi:PliI family lysozyme inhibitor of I-type lysozyme [Sphingobacterium sp. UT-1RO-CII-1]|uniref:PliI family lysozyme inhibitor of I-type lysozyme n=1 Tax=Sphingobacterium sp. UT-1RO-CII-1 TaxID=2995225 RepID=UPI00227ADCC6|nr:PliI family lysozyme inhibitor of I-type lysozyme [Sphingobacterium sp. UT-1RO-CII-1]MCY4780555.1 PliI family lysozyme inhibitor of I-type lysozyme [Sphingobacterium sp. UT-1RO-CII-1]